MRWTLLRYIKEHIFYEFYTLIILNECFFLTLFIYVISLLNRIPALWCCSCYYTCDAVAAAAIISSMMQSTLTLKTDKVDVSMVFIVAHSWSRTHIIWYKLENFGLDFSFFSCLLAALSHIDAIDLIHYFVPTHSVLSSARRLFVTLSFSMHFAVDYKRLSNLDVKYVIKPNVFKTHFTLIDQYIGKSKCEYFIAVLLQSVSVWVWVWCILHETRYTISQACVCCCRLLLWLRFIHFPLSCCAKRKSYISSITSTSTARRQYEERSCSLGFSPHYL